MGGSIMATKRGVANNEKAIKFQEFLIDNDINVFSVNTVDDEYETVIFRSRIETNGQILPMAIVIDTSLFTIIRTQIVNDIEDSKREAIKDYLNELNNQYKIFKYYLQANGTILVDICLPFTDEKFDSNLIQLMLSVLVQHLETVYHDIMAKVWGR